MRMMYLPPPPAMTRRKKHRGFNLIESAIVLGVVGLLIGGIWVAASAVSENHKVQLAATGMAQIVRNMNGLFPKEAVVNAATMVSLNLGNWKEQVYANVDGYTISPWPAQSPFGRSVTSLINTSGYIIIIFPTLQLSHCIKMIALITAGYASNDLYMIRLNNGSSTTDYNSFPLINPGCGSTNNIQFWFRRNYYN
jgi:prepilin-type N-terminal cleavage/methylation domain-containing protein